MKKSLAWITIVMVTQQACGDSAAAGEWTGSVRDSAGISIVENPATGSWSQSSAWTVEPVVTIGAAEGEEYLQFGQITGMALGKNGDIHVFDFQAAQIRSFSSEGDYIRTISKKGNGPGEIAAGAGLFLGLNDSLIVPDVGARRISSFPSDGSDGESFPIDLPQAQPVRFETTPEGVLVAQLRTFTGGGGTAIELGSHDLIATLTEEGLDTLATIPVGQTINLASDIPQFHIFAPEPLWTLGRGSSIFIGRNSETRIRRYDDGELALVITRAVEPQPVTESDERRIASAIERAMKDTGQVPARVLERILSTLTVADYFPTMLQLQDGPEGSLWVQRFTQLGEMSDEEAEAFNPLDLGSRFWEVFDVDGKLLGDVEMPDKFQPIGFTDTQVYGIWRDELDVQYAMVARINRP